MATRVRSERTSLSNCANAARTPSINFPVDVSSIGSLADRNEMPRDFRCEPTRSGRTCLHTVALWRRCVAREAREIEDDDEVDLALVRAAEGQKSLQLGAVRGLGALALFLESLEDLEPFAVAVLFAGPELGRQAEVLGLLLGADADVDDGADH